MVTWTWCRCLLCGFLFHRTDAGIAEDEALCFECNKS